MRFVEPDQVTAPAEGGANPAASFGILTDESDVETVLAYYVDGRPVDADQIQHRKANVDANVKRGLPLFFPVRKNLRRAEKLLRNMSVVAEIQSAIALIRKHQGGVRGGVQQFAASQTDLTVTQQLTGRTTSFRRFGPGTILDAPGGIEYDFPAAGLDAANFVAVLQAELRAIASRLVMPEFMLTSDASNANYSSTMMAEGPAMRMFARLQADLIQDDLEVMYRVVQAAVDAGGLPNAALQDVVIQAAPPSLEVRDPKQEAEVQQIEYQNGILSPQTWSSRRGLDYDQEQANLARHNQRTQEQPGPELAGPVLGVPLAEPLAETLTLWRLRLARRDLLGRRQASARRESPESRGVLDELRRPSEPTKDNLGWSRRHHSSQRKGCKADQQDSPTPGSAKVEQRPSRRNAEVLEEDRGRGSHRGRSARRSGSESRCGKSSRRKGEVFHSAAGRGEGGQ